MKDTDVKTKPEDDQQHQKKHTAYEVRPPKTGVTKRYEGNLQRVGEHKG